jgi:hypothetical protein
MSNVNDDDSPRDGESVTVEEDRSWLGRLGQSVVGIVFGILLGLGGALAYGALHRACVRKAARLPEAAPAT